MRGHWEGDVDGSLQVLFAQYQSRCALVKRIGLDPVLNSTRAIVEKIRVEFDEDQGFLRKGSEKASKEYNDVVEGGRSSESKLMGLAWSVAGFQELLKKSMAMAIALDSVLNDFTDDALRSCIKMKPDLLKYIKDLYSKK